MKINKLRSSRKKPDLQFWFFSGDGENPSAVQNTRAVIGLIKSKSRTEVTYVGDKNAAGDLSSWSHELPAFLIGAEGR